MARHRQAGVANKQAGVGVGAGWGACGGGRRGGGCGKSAHQNENRPGINCPPTQKIRAGNKAKNAARKGSGRGGPALREPAGAGGAYVVTNRDRRREQRRVKNCRRAQRQQGGSSGKRQQAARYCHASALEMPLCAQRHVWLPEQAGHSRQRAGAKALLPWQQ